MKNITTNEYWTEKNITGYSSDEIEYCFLCNKQIHNSGMFSIEFDCMICPDCIERIYTPTTKLSEEEKIIFNEFRD